MPGFHPLAANLRYLPLHVAFGLLAAAMVIAAVGVVTTKNVVHAALYLVVVLAGVAGLYILAAAEFVAAVQVLVYIGAIVVLFLFGIMLTRAPIGRTADLDNDQRLPAVLVALALAGLLGTILVNAYGDKKVTPDQPVHTAPVSIALFQQFVIPFEVVSVLLLAALIGAVVLARRD